MWSSKHVHPRSSAVDYSRSKASLCPEEGLRPWLTVSRTGNMEQCSKGIPKKTQNVRTYGRSGKIVPDDFESRRYGPYLRASMTSGTNSTPFSRIIRTRRIRREQNCVTWSGAKPLTSLPEKSLQAPQAGMTVSSLCGLMID